MLEKLDVIKHTENLFDKNGFITNVACGGVIISKVNELIDAVNELQHDNSEKANCQENVLTMVDNQVTANLPNIDLGELAFLSKENTELKDEIDRLETELERTRKALNVALDWLGQVATLEKCDDDLCREFTKRKLAEIKTALEQKDK